MRLFNLPNALTLVNLLAGCFAVVFIFSYQWDYVPYCVVVSLLADFLDGFAARFTKNSTEIGKELDSLADMVSFGLVPGAIVFQLLLQLNEGNTASTPTTVLILSAPGFLITLFAALRLAKFNLDTRQSDGFIGLATPAATIFVVGYMLVFLHGLPYLGMAMNAHASLILYGISLVLPVLMIAEIPMFSFKFKSFGWKGNEIRYLFIILSVVLLLTLKLAAISLVIVLYIIISVILKLIKP